MFDLSLISVGTVLLLGIVIAFQAKRFGRIKQVAEDNQQQLRSLQNELKALYAAAAGMGGRLARIEHRLNDVSDRQEFLEVKDPTIHNYSEAIEMAHRGAGVEQLMRHCGLLKEEAELLVRLHGSETVD